MRKLYCGLGAILATFLMLASMTSNAGRYGGGSSGGGGRSYSSGSSYSSSAGRSLNSSASSFSRGSSSAGSSASRPAGAYSSGTSTNRSTVTKPSSPGPFTSRAPTYRSPAVYSPSRTVSGSNSFNRSTVIEHNHYYGGGLGYYGGGYGGSLFHNPFFWMWALDNHNQYYPPGAYVAGYGTVPPGAGVTLNMPVPIPWYETLALWIGALAALWLFVYLLVVLWRVCEETY